MKYGSSVTFSLSYRISKRLFDIVLSTIALIILSPIFLMVLILNRTDNSSRGPLFYKQIRVGLHGTKFGMYKFRSMVVDAEKKLHADKALYEVYIENNYKLEPENDPRITRIGRFLRATSIDEIPQFINILRGEMSIVGPRPVVEEELIEYNEAKLLSVKPGAMGLWQASGRSKIGYPERAQIEMSYIDNANLWYDFKIIILNLVNIFRREGAY
ncbi:multidrug MFS transporter [Lactobacillus heilongjiangensis] [Lactiplantibacillus mudanjiangensis]|uniref:Multidrug MFS transporter [Lactobacillus heilongjiangensis] n=1 Tax=Lactiplantibacillus mudanjiangensis TaxID=1296538 RepID=A0A660E921_9LACO|nr:sugar transferase [Lactiplantibacillus mudanjiangensis]VDG23435.1 multidrug MFS transporter [Lactobacillus heilongjiangensis] [Lactiplantibacillus mudanjiangensis]VDG29631.1 multidrug MFS transporter [Lactobacillus heilongjiangensis] [Lactiplantibacillus mudanjiangensis]